LMAEKDSTIYVSLDTETGGLDPLENNLLEVAVYSPTVGEDSFYVWEGHLSVDPRAMEVNGIDLETVRDVGLSPRQAVTRLTDFFMPMLVTHRVQILGSNIGFDVGFLRRLYACARQDWSEEDGRCSTKPPSIPQYLTYRTLDTGVLLWAAKQAGLLPEDLPLKTDAALEFFCIQPEEGEARHRALGDAKMIFELHQELVRLLQRGHM